MGQISKLARWTAARLNPRFVREPECGGCGARLGTGVRLISGPGVYLCTNCLQRAAAQLTPRRPPTDAVRCRFCRQLRPPADATRVGVVTVCADCLGVMADVVGEAGQPSRPAT